MKAITVRQPWAWAILFGQKDVENRSRNIAGSYRGPLIIHAGLIPDADLDRRIARAIGELSRSGRKLAQVPALATDPDLPGNRIAPWYGNRGAALGIVDLTDSHRCGIGYACHCEPFDTPLGTGYATVLCSEWGESSCQHLVLANPRPFPKPIAYRGALGLWEFPDELLPEVAW